MGVEGRSQRSGYSVTVSEIEDIKIRPKPEIKHFDMVMGRISKPAMRALKRHAAITGEDTYGLIARIAEIVASDDLFSAVLDDE